MVKEVSGGPFKDRDANRKKNYPGGGLAKGSKDSYKPIMGKPANPPVGYEVFGGEGTPSYPMDGGADTLSKGIKALKITKARNSDQSSNFPKISPDKDIS